ncbi:T-box protein 20 [Intoshia linei]|uniref:T-box protein 20 n=1 Tax=Intoshia linei TaxID=1819745 RepID=A0A177B1F5_9BILA|nr:T-box protein 20 [Intoshia linei]
MEKENKISSNVKAFSISNLMNLNTKNQSHDIDHGGKEFEHDLSHTSNSDSCQLNNETWHGNNNSLRVSNSSNYEMQADTNWNLLTDAFQLRSVYPITYNPSLCIDISNLLQNYNQSKKYLQIHQNLQQNLLKRSIGQLLNNNSNKTKTQQLVNYSKPIVYQEYANLPKFSLSCSKIIIFVSLPEKHVISTGSDAMKDIFCELETKELWNKFYNLGTEMIITKSGRRMFPTICVSFKNLDPYQLYYLMLDIHQVDGKRYRYAYHRSCWLIAGKADIQNKNNIYLHPDGVQLGKNLLNRSISFEKLKLTNNNNNKHGHIVLNSMHKYEPRIHIVKVSTTLKANYKNWEKQDHRTFIFPNTVFIVVTAYQNQLITKLKIDSNPFAKGFRDIPRSIRVDRYCYEQLTKRARYKDNIDNDYNESNHFQSGQMKRNNVHFKPNDILLGKLDQNFHKYNIENNRPNTAKYVDISKDIETENILKN